MSRPLSPPSGAAPTALTGAEALAASAVALLAWIVVLGYAIDRVGMTIVPSAILLSSAGATMALSVYLGRRATWDARELAAFVGVTAAALGWLLWLAWPALLPPGRGPDLAHHLLLIDYIERHWRLVHDARVEIYLGQMVAYTPGGHILAALGGAWAGTDGLHAFYPLIAWSVAIKAGFIFVICCRVVPRGGPRIPFALIGVLLLFLPRAYLVGSFTHDSFFAQVVSETFAVAMWWAVAAWDEQPWPGAMAVFAVAGAAAFLTWPVWIGPPVMALVAIVLLREGIPVRRRLAHVALALGPVVAIAAVYTAGRTGYLQLVRISAGVSRPVPADFGWLFLILSAVGLVIAACSRRARATLLLFGALALQAVTFYALARQNRSETPYMALKMFYLAIYPSAVVGALAVAVAYRAVAQIGDTRRWAERLIWVLVVLAGIVTGRTLVAFRRPTPIVAPPLYLAGQWARAHVAPACVDYLVADSDAAYWLHLAVLGNRWMSARTRDSATFDPHAAIVRWIEPRSLRFAIADVAVIPKPILADVDILADFGQAVVVRRRGEAVCPGAEP